MNILGIDLGNNYVKTSAGVKFPSTLKAGHMSINKDDIKVSYKGTKWTVGNEDGIKNIGIDKYRNHHFKILLLTSIIKSVSDNKNVIQCKIVLGIPAEYYNIEELKEGMKKEILSWGEQSILVNNILKTIVINDVEIFMESGIVFSHQERFANEKTLVIDIGGSTIDISMWKGLDLINLKTITNGCISLNERVISLVNETYKTNLNSYIAGDMINKKEYTINQEMKDISFIEPLIDSYILEISSTIRQYFNYQECNSIQFIGGGSISLKDTIIKYFEKAEIEIDSEFKNANTYKKVGEMIWL